MSFAKSRQAPRFAALMLALTTPAALVANEPETKPSPSDKLFADLLAEAEKPQPTAPAEDFGKAAAACSAALGPMSMDASKLEPLGWTATIKPASDESAWMFEQQPGTVRIFLATMFAPSGQCVVDGYAASEREFGAISKEVEKQVGAALGKKLKNTGSMGGSGSFSRGQGFLADSLMVSISSENRTNGMSIRITMMQIDKSRSAYETASAAGMAAQYLPMLAEQPAPAEKTETEPAPSPQ